MMDVKDAIAHFERYLDNEFYTDKYKAACKMAIDALRAQLAADHVRDAAKMMPRLIDADALMQAFWDEVEAGNQLGYGDTEELIKNAPAIDPESLRPHGRWEEINGYLRCSECKDVYIYEDWIEDGKWKFCPNCGAQMDKEMLESEVSE